MKENYTLPFYIRLTITLLALICLTYIFYVGQNIIIPVMIVFLFAILLRPVVLFFTDRLRCPHVLAVMFTVLLLVLCFVGLFAFISIQVTDIASDFDKIERNFIVHLHNLENLVKEKLNLSVSEQREYIDGAAEDSLEKGKEMIGTTLLSFTDTLLNITLVPIYTFLILLYRTHFMMFLAKLFTAEHHEKLKDILMHIKVAVKSYIVGLLIEMVAVSVMTTVGFMIIGVEYAILLGIITGLLNLIPYVGILFAGILSIVVSLTGSPDLSIIIGVVVVNIIVQLIDNNILVPMIVSSKVQVNAMVSIVGIIIGGALAGVAGMFLAIPIIAILKVIFDRIDHLSPWGYLMGDDLPKTYKWHRIKLPLYDYGNSRGHINLQVDIPPPTFTESNTITDTNSPITQSDNKEV